MRAVLAVCLVLVAAVAAEEISSLPGLDAMPEFKMRSGYITLTGQRQVFYWLVDSARAPSTDPLVVWYQGGPGCSGLAGLFQENGPFVVGRDQKLQPNPFSWNKFANMLFIEQPVGVGFSNDASQPLNANYSSSDSGAAADNYLFLQNFVKAYPEFSARKLWFSGESYGGMYMPTLAHHVVTGDDAQLKTNFQGMMLGNPVLFCESAGLEKTGSIPWQFNRFFYNGLLSFNTLMAWKAANCDDMLKFSGAELKKCSDMFAAAQKSVGVIYQQLKQEEKEASKLAFLKAPLEEAPVPQADLDPDDLYQDFCTGNGTLDASFGDVKDCKPLGNVLTTYLNNADVQKAIHARVGTTWGVCSNTLQYNSDYQPQGLIPFLETIFEKAPQLHILYYSGDVDVATVPMMTTQACLNELAPKVKATKAWRPWTVNGWHAGYVETFDRYTFASVKGAGHEVPQFQPLTSFQMAQRWIEKQDITEPAKPTRVGGRAGAGRPMTQGGVLNERMQQARAAHVQAGIDTEGAVETVV